MQTTDRGKIKALISQLFVAQTNSSLIQLFRYTFVGGVAFVVDFGMLWFLTEIFHLHYLISAAISFMMGLTTNFTISVFWVFPASRIENRRVEFAIFGIIGVAGLGMNELIIYVCSDIFAIHYLVSKVISTILVFGWNFVARKFILYR